MRKKIIGRIRELKLLDRIWNSKEAEFLVVYGRRRIGKTHLIREYFSNNGVYIEATGLKDGSQKDQIALFMQALARGFYPNLRLAVPGSWMEAFEELTRAIEAQPKSKKVTIFLDELPWMATKRSGMIQALDHYWNSRWSRCPNLQLIACGSAASWMLDHLINATGGLHNRVTQTLLLRPFSLAESKSFLTSRDGRFSDKQVLDIYMVTGGVPHYLKQINKSLSVPQNIDALCFQRDGLLFDEFPRLFRSLFSASEVNLDIVREVAKHRHGISRELLLTKLNKRSGGRFATRLNELQAAGFIEIYVPYGYTKRNLHLRVIDEYTLFYLRWIEPYRSKGFALDGQGHWQTLVSSAAYHVWAGYAFEAVCFKHVGQIRAALGITSIACDIGSWRYLPKRGAADDGAEIDLLFDRSDDVTSLCEIKYSKGKYTIDKGYGKNLLNKARVFATRTRSDKQTTFAMITTLGVKKNLWSEELISSEVTLRDLFMGN